MFTAYPYRIVETKEEFVKHWKPEWNRYRGAALPKDINYNDPAIFPLALRYNEPWEPGECGTWSIAPLEDAVQIIYEAYNEDFKRLTEQKERLCEMFSLKY